MKISKAFVFACILALALIGIGIFSGCSSTSNNTTTPTPTPILTLSAPNGGESWFVGRTANIAWTSSDLTGNVKIEFTPLYGTDPWQTLAGSLPLGNHSFIWNITGTKTSHARVRITSVEQPTIGDTSNGDFTLVACPTLCENAATLALNEAVTLCTIDSSGPDTINWFTINLNPSRYRFQLNGFTTGQDLDFYVKTVCGGDNIFWGINGIERNNGYEDTTWTPPYGGDYLISIRRPAERTSNHGQYTLVVSPAAAPADYLPPTTSTPAVVSKKNPARS